MNAMTEEEARTIMKQPKGVAKYVYAKRRQGKDMLQRYICPVLQLPNLTEDELVAKLVMEPAKKPSSAEREPEVSDTTDPLTHTDE
jgi:hypothetical protein